MLHIPSMKSLKSPGRKVLKATVWLGTTTAIGAFGAIGIPYALKNLPLTIRTVADFQGDISRRANQQTVHLPDLQQITQQSSPQPENTAPQDPVAKIFEGLRAKGEANLSDIEKQCLVEYDKLKTLGTLNLPDTDTSVQDTRRKVADCIANKL